MHVWHRCSPDVSLFTAPQLAACLECPVHSCTRINRRLVVSAVIPALPKGPHSTHDDASISLSTYRVIHQVWCLCPRTKLWQLNPRESSELVPELNCEGALGECMIGSFIFHSTKHTCPCRFYMPAVQVCPTGHKII